MDHVLRRRADAGARVLGAARPRRAAYITNQHPHPDHGHASAGSCAEQVPIYMCPWPRIQSAMMDEKSLTGDLQALARRAARASQRRPRRPQTCSATASTATSAWRCAPRRGSAAPRTTSAKGRRSASSLARAVYRRLRPGHGGDQPPARLIDYAIARRQRARIAGEAPRLRGGQAALRLRTLVWLLVWGAIGAGLLFALGAHAPRHLPGARPQPAVYADERRIGAQCPRRQAAPTCRASRARCASRSRECPGAAMWTDAMPRRRDRAARLDAPPRCRQTRPSTAHLHVIAPPARGRMGDFFFTVTTIDKRPETDINDALRRPGGMSMGKTMRRLAPDRDPGRLLRRDHRGERFGMDVPWSRSSRSRRPGLLPQPRAAADPDAHAPGRDRHAARRGRRARAIEAQARPPRPAPRSFSPTRPRSRRPGPRRRRPVWASAASPARCSAR